LHLIEVLVQVTFSFHQREVRAKAHQSLTH
jgi:hypothetical protein